MMVTRYTLLKKIAGFPQNWKQGIHLLESKSGALAIIDSWTTDTKPPKSYTVSLQRHPESNEKGDAELLEGTCECAASEACKHMGQLFAARKGITPEHAEQILRSLTSVASETLDHGEPSAAPAPPKAPQEDVATPQGANGDGREGEQGKDIAEARQAAHGALDKILDP